MTGKNDFENYRKMSEPFESTELADEAVERFFDAVAKARNENHIADVHVIIKTNVIKNGKEGQGISTFHIGNSRDGAMMCAYALGQERAEDEEEIRNFLKAKGTHAIT
jgi:hypothetical protein